MNRGWLLFALSGVLAAFAVLATILSFGFPPVFLLAVALAAGSYGCWTRARERIAENVYTRVGVEPNPDGTIGDEGSHAERSRSARVTYEPSDEWDDPDDWPFEDPFWSDPDWSGPRRGTTGASNTRQQTAERRTHREKTRFLAPREREACSVLGVEVGASREEIRTAYRERVKDAHPDHGGDEAAFKRVRWAYEYLRRRRDERR